MKSPGATTRVAATVACLVLAGMGTARQARAEDVPHLPPSDDVDEAQLRFRRGVDLYTEGNFSGALVELKRAYQLAPNFRILFDLGQLSYQRHDYAGALDYFTRYLNDGAGWIPDLRRQQVQADLEQLLQRVGYLDITGATAGQRVLVDGHDVGATPLAAAVATNVGSHRVELVTAMGDRQVRVVETPGGQTTPVPFAPPTLHPSVPEVSRLAPSPLPAPETETRTRRLVPWVSWTATALAGAAAATTGAIAWKTSLDLHHEIDSYPVSQDELESLRSREHRFALASDGFLVGTLVLAAVSLYLAFPATEHAVDKPGSALARAGF